MKPRLPLAVALGFLALALPGRAEDRAAFRTERVSILHLDDVWAPPTPERTVELYLRALTAGRAPVPGLGPKDFLVRDEGRRIDSGDLSVSLLEDARRGVACVLVLDRSPTMQAPFPEAKAAALSFLDRVGSYDRVAVLGVAGTVDTGADFTASKPEVRQAIDRLRVNEEPAATRLYDGIHRAVEMIRSAKDLPRRSLVIVFSDGQDGGSDHSLEEVIALAQGGVGEPRVLVYTIAYPTGFGDRGLQNLRRLAEDTTADFLRVEADTPITDFYGDIWAQVMKSYVLRFPGRFDGESHRIEVATDGDAKDQRTGRYPEGGGGLLPWLLGALGALLFAMGALVLAMLRRAGALVFLRDGSGPGRRVRLRRGLNRIGQAADNDIVIDHDTVSRRHAEIEVKARRARIRDLESTNGTFVNDVQIEGERVLEDGDRIRISDIDLVYQR